MILLIDQTSANMELYWDGKKLCSHEQEEIEWILEGRIVHFQNDQNSLEIFYL